jgi:hypothetical protein
METQNNNNLQEENEELNEIKKEKNALRFVIYIGCFLLIVAFIPKIFIDLNIFDLNSIWIQWEFLSVVWSLSFVIYYGIIYTSTGNFKNDKLVFLFIVMLFLISVATLIFLLLHRVLSHLVLGGSLSLVFCILDYFVSEKHQDPYEKKVHKISFLLADVPFVVCNTVLFLWLWLFQPSEWEIFAGGVIAAHLIVGNLIFIIIQSGQIRKIWKPDKISNGV